MWEGAAMAESERRSLRSSAVHGVKWTSASMVTTTVIGLVQLAILTRLLSRSDFGLMAMIATVIGFAQVYADMGFSGAIIYRQHSSRDVLSSLYWTNLLAGIGLFAVIVGVSPLVARFFHEPQLVDLMRWASLIFLITPLGQQFQMLLQRELLFRRLGVIEIVASALGLCIAVASGLAHQGVYALIWAQLTVAAVKAALLALYGWRRWTPRLHLRLGDLKGYVSFGLYQMGERSIYYWAANIDYLLIGRFLGPEQLGLYSIAYNLVVMPLTKLVPVLTRVAFPLFARRQDDDAALRRGYCELVELVAFVTFPLLVGLAATSSVAVVAVFGATWASSVVLVQLLTPMGMAKSISSPTGSLLLAKGRADLGFWANVTNTVVMICALIVAVQYGTKAVAATHSVLAVGLMPIDLYLLWRVSRLRWVAYLKRLVRPLLTSGIMGAVVYGTCVALRGTLPPAIALIVLVVEGALVYLLAWRVVARGYVPALWRDWRAKSESGV